MMRPVAGPQCRGRKPPTGQAIVTGIGGDGRRLGPCAHRARPTGTGGGPTEYRRRSPSWKNARFPRGSGKPYGAIGERGFPPPAPLTGKAGSLRPRPRRPHGAAAGKRAAPPEDWQSEERRISIHGSPASCKGARPYQGSNEFQVKPSTEGIGGAGKHGKRYPLIVGVKKPVELRSTGVQPLRHLALPMFCSFIACSS
jgi:hypothetical protein